MRKREIYREKRTKMFFIEKKRPFLRFFKFVILFYTQFISSLQRTKRFSRKLMKMIKKVTNFVLNKLHMNNLSLFRTNEEGITIRKSRFRKFKSKGKKITIAAQIVAIWYLLIISGSYLTTETGAYFNDIEVIENSLHVSWDDSTPSDDKWEKSSLQEVTQGGTCEKGIYASFTNTGESVDHELTKYEVYWSATGNPKNGTKVSEGTFPIPHKGEVYEINYQPTENGYYKFRAYHEVGHNHDYVKSKGPWSGTIKVDCSSQVGVTPIDEVVILEAKADQSSVNLLWKNPSGIDSVNIYRNDTQIATNLVGDTFIDTNLEPNKTYTYRIAIVMSGNETFGNEFEISTSSVVVQPPSDNDVQPTPAIDDKAPGEVEGPNWKRANNGNNNIDLTWINPKDEDFDHLVIEMYKNGTKEYEVDVGKTESYQFNLPDRDIEFLITVISVDKVGNKSIGKSVTVSIPKK